MQAPQNYTHIQRSPHMFYRNKVINQFHTQLSIVVLVTSSLTTYMARAHDYAKGILFGRIQSDGDITELNWYGLAFDKLTRAVKLTC